MGALSVHTVGRTTRLALLGAVVVVVVVLAFLVTRGSIDISLGSGLFSQLLTPPPPTPFSAIATTFGTTLRHTLTPSVDQFALASSARHHLTLLVAGLQKRGLREHAATLPALGSVFGHRPKRRDKTVLWDRIKLM